eukprot:TRINITY_DN11897_c0_g1_i1.p2 TRINITY_DN11897_c0_g1~~TRINITY_DN11897_c0_g1_i1.p2  ORF type:complete len:191 (+),score=25.50 TRINITY_DN11897_c0_g1_i1:152-724(+)
MGQSAGTDGQADPVELRSPDDVGSKGRLSRPYPWSNLVRRVMAAPSTAAKVRKARCSEEDWEPTDTQVILLLERADPRLRELIEGPEEFLRLCPESEQAGQGANMVPVEWAAGLLEKEPSLRQVRFKLVPRKISEEVFWARYFGAVFAILEEEILDAAPLAGAKARVDVASGIGSAVAAGDGTEDWQILL